jgi:UDP-N-acetylglucosamine/UDP-N-acetylgalactosamine 4-epimerase
MAAVTVVDIAQSLARRDRHWLLTGSAGFIGSHLLEALLRAGQRVTSLDNFSTGHRANLDAVRDVVGEAAWARHQFIDGDITDIATCRRACAGIQVVLHQAALGSVPRSLADPLATHNANATGFVNLLDVARCAGVTRFVYAASSSTYGDSPGLPKVEHTIGRPLSPYAVTKYLNELYADVYSRCYGIETMGLRYFNVFGPRQDPNGPYAAVIPLWAAQMLRGEPCSINGDGETSRDFCYVANAVQANLRAALVEETAALNQVFNVAVGQRTTLVQLHDLLATALMRLDPSLRIGPPDMRAFRDGDVRHSLADIGKASSLLGYLPSHDVQAGLEQVATWYIAQSRIGRATLE